MAKGVIGNGDWLTNKNLSTGYLSANSITYTGLYDSRYNTAVVAPYNEDVSIRDIDGMEMLEVIQKGVYKTLVSRRDDAKAIWEEEDDDASYGEYKALKDAVDLLDAFIKQAPNVRYSGRSSRAGYDGYGRRY